MPNQVLEEIAGTIKDLDKQIDEAQELLNALSEAGEDVTLIKADLSKLRVRKNKWERMLKARGYLK